MHGRTFEETFIYENIASFRNQDFCANVELPEGADWGAEYQTVYEAVKSPTFKKTEFALDLISTDTNWATPTYVQGGLKWLESKMTGQLEAEGGE